MRIALALAVCVFSLASLLPLPVIAQENVGLENVASEGVLPGDIPSLLFSHWEHKAIEDARRSIGFKRAPTDAELARELRRQKEEVTAKPPPEERDISLGGIVFASDGDWTIWLNGKRVTPSAIPEEVIDLRVFNEYIEIKWFDVWSNQIFPIRLRPHQRFNIDTRIFLPG